jgi:3-deoxy-D-manno-octulosonic-acid transferase
VKAAQDATWLGPLLRQVYRAAWYPALPFALIAAGARNYSIARQRLGQLDCNVGIADDSRRRIWVHASSVGEIEAVRPVIALLRKEISEIDIVLTTMTSAGREAASTRITGLTACQLAPLDFPAAVSRFVSELQPRLVIVAETELWPNFFWESARSGARIAIVNGRLSLRALARYRWVRPVFADLLSRCDRILVQTAADRDRFRELGAPNDRLIVTGNTKYNLGEVAQPLRRELAGFADNAPLLIAGSTAPDEERVIIAVYRKLVEEFTSLRLVIAPRHLKRVSEIEAMMKSERVSYIKATSLAKTGCSFDSGASILLLDTMGDLRGFYARATIAFVGGSLTPPRGGQSLAEPANAGVPVLFGPHYENQQEIGDLLIRQGGGKVVRDAAELGRACGAWLGDNLARDGAGRAAREVLERLASGAVATVDQLKPLLLGD